MAWKTAPTLSRCSDLASSRGAQRVAPRGDAPDIAMKYLLADGVHACKLDDGAVFLDLRRNQYIAVSPGSVGSLNETVEGFTSLGSSPSALEQKGKQADSEIRSLLARGILTDSRRHGKPASRAVIQASHAFTPGHRLSTSRTIRASHIERFTASVLYCTWNLRRHKPKPIIDRIAALRARPMEQAASGGTEVAAQVVEIFRRLRTFTYTAKNHCLLDSLILTDFLFRNGLMPTFIIGIRTKPFLAHAWVQIGDCVMDDKLESLEDLTPILVV